MTNLEKMAGLDPSETTVSEDDLWVKIKHLTDDLKFSQQHCREQSRELDNVKRELAQSKIDNVKQQRVMELMNLEIVALRNSCFMEGIDIVEIQALAEYNKLKGK